MEELQCSACSSTSLREVGPGRYVCNYCGTEMIAPEHQSAGGVTQTTPGMSRRRQRSLLIAAVTVFVLVAAAVAGVLASRRGAIHHSHHGHHGRAPLSGSSAAPPVVNRLSGRAHHPFEVGQAPALASGQVFDVE